MELRSCSSWHYIQSLKSGSVVKSLNVYRGRPSPKFKALKDIYEAEDENNQNRDDEFRGFLSGSIRIMAERPSMSDSDVSEFSCSENDTETNNGSDGVSTCVSDDVDCDMITLKQFRELCKEKKRKCSEIVDSVAVGPSIGACNETDADDCELMEPLIAWKRRISKKSRVKDRSLKRIVSTSPRGDLSIVKVEEIPTDQDFVVSTESLMAGVKVKEEAPEPDDTMSDLSLLCDDRVDVSRDSEATKINTVDDLESKGSVSDKNELWFTGDPPVDADGGDSIEASLILSDCKVLLPEDNQENSCGEISSEEALIATEYESPLIYTDHADCCESVPSGVTTIAPGFDLGAETSIALTQGPQHSGNSEMHCVSSANSECTKFVPPGEVTDTATEHVLCTEKLTSGIEKLPNCLLNEIYYDCEELEYSKTDVAEVVDDQGSGFPIRVPEGEGYTAQDPCVATSQESILPSSDCSDGVSDGFPCSTDSDLEVQSPDVSPHGSPKQIKAYTGSDSTALSGKDEPLPINEASAIYGSDEEYNLVPTSFFVSSPEDSPQADQSQTSHTSCGEDGHYSKLDQPKRLLSTRKDISPESQEKLCQAIESIEIHEEEHYRPQKKLCFEKPNVNEVKDNKDESHGRINIRFSLKPKHGKRNSQTNATPNGPQPSRGGPRFTTGCNSVEICSQSAIAFSQRQMQDIESLALKLTNELKTMKEITEDRLYSEASPSSSVKYKPSEVRMAIKSATKLEQLANKWLSMMARDCNRFCKIMTLAEKEPDSSKTEIVGNKDRKRITFADEAGEELCQVKFFEKTKSSETDTENSEIIRF